MPKMVLDVGQCAADHASIRRLVETHFDAEVQQSHLAADTLAALRQCAADLVLVNRKLDTNNRDGLEIIKQIKADTSLPATDCMLISNFAEHQAAAAAAGAEPGFGKAELGSASTLELLERYLGPRKN